MTDRTTLEALLARVLEGAEPDQELDAEIAVSLFGGEIIWKTANYIMEQYPVRRIQNSAYIGGYQNVGVLAYTASLDAALTLVPEGWRYDLSSGDLVEKPAARLTPDCAGSHFEGYAQTVSRALIAAYLKAMMEAQPSSDT